MYLCILLLIIIICCIVKNEDFIDFIGFPRGIPTRNTRGMAYDLRCTPNIKKMYVPWGYATLYPNHYGKCLDLN